MSQRRGHHLAGDIGLAGVARNVGGRLAPHYMLHLGGGAREDGAVLFGTPIDGEEDFLDLGASFPEAFPAVRTGPYAP